VVLNPVGVGCQGGVGVRQDGRGGDKCDKGTQVAQAGWSFLDFPSAYKRALAGDWI
jgi:hypothetical protein